MSNIFGLSIFFVTDLPLYLLQGGRKTAFVENIYIRSRFRERQTASNIEKRWNRWTDFLHFLPFFVKESPLYLQQGGRETWSKTPKKEKKSWKKHWKNIGGEKKTCEKNISIFSIDLRKNKQNYT